MKPNILFKSPREDAEWELVNPRIRALVCYTSSLLEDVGHECVVTGLLRTRQEQIAIYGDAPPISVHEVHRGADIRANLMDKKVAQGIVDTINSHMAYDLERPNLKTALLHGKGANIHIHLQVRA